MVGSHKNIKQKEISKIRVKTIKSYFEPLERGKIMGTNAEIYTDTGQPDSSQLN